MVGGGWRRRGILKVPLCKRGFLRLRAQGETDSHASDVGHWLGMTVLRAGGAARTAGPTPLVIARSEATRQSALLYLGDGFPRQ